MINEIYGLRTFIVPTKNYNISLVLTNYSLFDRLFEVFVSALKAFGSIKLRFPT